MIIIPKKDTKCKECVWAVYLEGKCALQCGYICKLNPFKQVSMGLDSKHQSRKNHLEK